MVKVNNFKYIATFVMLTLALTTQGQWTYKTINSEFDGVFKKAYTETDNNGWLMMEVGIPDDDDSSGTKLPVLFLRGSYFCDDYLFVDMVLVVNGENKKYLFKVYKSNDNKILVFRRDIWTESFIADFKGASKCLIRVNESHCGDEYYRFSMTGSTAAYNFIVK